MMNQNKSYLDILFLNSSSYKLFLFLCVSVMVLAADTWSASASGFHLLHHFTDADVLSLPRDPTKSGVSLCSCESAHSHFSTLKVISVLKQRNNTKTLALRTFTEMWNVIEFYSVNLQVCWWSPVQDVVLYWPEWIFILLLETGWLCFTFLLPVPNCPTWVAEAPQWNTYINPHCNKPFVSIMHLWHMFNLHPWAWS